MEKLVQLLADLEEEAALAQIREKLDAGQDPLAILEECREGMTLVGKRYEDGEYFVSDLMMAGEIFKQGTDILSTHLVSGAGEARGKIVIGTVKGDIHDIGKDLVVALLKAANYEVHDLGVDVAPEVFVAKVQETGAKVVGLSGLLTIAFDAMRDTVVALADAGLRPGVKVMIGGGPVTAGVCEFAGADGWANDARSAVTMADRWI